MNINRRKFITTTALALPLPTLVAGNVIANNINSSKRRSSNSYFTHDELKSWCEKNGCHYLTDNELKDKNLVIAFTITSKDIEVNENYMDMWLKEMRNERGNPDYRFMIVDVVPHIYKNYSGGKEYTSVWYIYGRL